MIERYPRTFSFPQDSITYEVPRWAELTDLIFLVAQKISANNLEFDRIVSLAKGGWPMARTLADFLKIRDTSSIGTRLYSGINEQLENLEIYQDLHDIKGERILLLDDVSDSGKTLHFVTNHIKKQGAASVITATVYYKPHSIFKPDYYSAETTSWIIFPYEIIESSLLLNTTWLKQGIDRAERILRLEKIGCKQEWLEFMQLS